MPKAREREADWNPNNKKKISLNHLIKWESNGQMNFLLFPEMV